MECSNEDMPQLGARIIFDIRKRCKAEASQLLTLYVFWLDPSAEGVVRMWSSAQLREIRAAAIISVVGSDQVLTAMLQKVQPHG